MCVYVCHLILFHFGLVLFLLPVLPLSKGTKPLKDHRYISHGSLKMSLNSKFSDRTSHWLPVRLSFCQDENIRHFTIFLYMYRYIVLFSTSRPREISN